MTPPSRDTQNPNSSTFIRAVIGGSVIPPPTPPARHDPAALWTVEHTFKIAPSGLGVGEARRWALSLTSTTCAARDELSLVLSELLGNVAVHADGGEVTITLAHSPAGLVGSLTHHQPPTADLPEIPTQIGNEISRLLDLDGPPDDEFISALADGGRGLFTIAALTARTTQTHRDAHSTTTRWTLDSCRCLTLTSPQASS